MFDGGVGDILDQFEPKIHRLYLFFFFTVVDHHHSKINPSNLVVLIDDRRGADRSIVEDCGVGKFGDVVHADRSGIDCYEGWVDGFGGEWESLLVGLRVDVALD